MKQKVALLLVVATIWMSLIMVVPSWGAISELDLTSSTTSSYTNCIASFRNDAKDARLAYFGIPMLPAASPTPKPQYLVINLKSGAATIRMAVRRADLYVVGYADKVRSGTKEEERAHFFKDAPADVKDIFPGAKRVDMSYKSSYQEIEIKAGVKDRQKFGLGIKKLASRVTKVYGVAPVNVKTEAEMMLLAIQMICEAARFSYIENQVKSNLGKDEFTPDYKLIRLENRWDKLSTAIKGADTKTGKFKSPVDLVYPNGTAYSVSSVNEVKADIALLKYVGNTFLTTAAGLITGLIGLVLLYIYIA